MAEIWPRLRKKSAQGKSRKGSKGAANPFASIGLEKFARLVEELQAKQQAATTLVERTASSLSAARCISRSAQEWTASTVTRAASRYSPDTTTKVSQGEPPVGIPVGELQQPESEILREERQAQGCREEVSAANSSSSPLGVRLPTRRCRSMASESVFVMLLALSAFLSARAGKVGKPLATFLTFSAVVRIWRKGKLSARLMFSSTVLYVFTPLRSYLVRSIPKRLILLPRNPESSQDAASEVAQPEPQDQSGSPVVELPVLPILKTSPSSESLIPVTLPVSKKIAGSSSRRLANKISSRLKKLKVFRLSSSTTSVPRVTESFSAAAPSSPKSSGSNPRRMCPFSRKTSDVGVAKASKGLTPSSSLPHDSRSKCKLLRREHSSETVRGGSSTCMGSRFGRMMSSETLELYNQMGEECSIGSSTASSLSPSRELVAAAVAPVTWPMVGLLVTLLFLVVGRVPAIMATSLFFVVVSPHSRSRDRRESRAFWEAASRKLHHSPPSPPRWERRALSPPPRTF